MNDTTWVVAYINGGTVAAYDNEQDAWDRLMREVTLGNYGLDDLEVFGVKR